MKRLWLIFIFYFFLANHLLVAFGQEEDFRLQRDLVRLKAFSGELKMMAKEMVSLQKSFGLKQRGHYTSLEHDKIVNLLFRYLGCRESLYGLLNYYLDYKKHFEDPNLQTKGFIIGFSSALHLAYYSSKLVWTFIDEPQVIKKLNEEFYRYEIPPGTYDRLFQNLTSIQNLLKLKAAWQLFSMERKDPLSPLSKIVRSEPPYRSLVKQMGKLHKKALNRIQAILEKKSLFHPEVRNRLRNTQIVILVKKILKGFDQNLYAARGILFETVSDFKNPLSSLIRFSPEQVNQMKSLLQPGDIILTFTDGYMSNIFLPGKFKHGIIYVGSPEDRREIGLFELDLKEIPRRKRKKFTNLLNHSQLPNGYSADVIEAVAEGVIFNSFEYLTASHINRLVILRPRLNQEDRLDGLTVPFLLLGNGYDFKFDFENASYHCCTEVIYRALHGRGNIQFSLVNRMGTPTLSADDVIEYHLSSKTKVFDFILLARENPDSDSHEAEILTGSSGEKQFSSLMQET